MGVGVALWWACGPAGVCAQGMEERVSLDLRSTEIADALKYLAQRGDLDLAISQEVSGRVHLLLTDVSIRDAFDLILRTNGLAYDRQGSIYHVMTEAEYQRLYGSRFSDLRQVRTFRLQHVAAEQALRLLDPLKSDVGRVLADEASRTLLLLETPARLKEMEKVLTALDRKGREVLIEARMVQVIPPGRTRLLSHPRLLVAEGQQARLHVGTREAYVRGVAQERKAAGGQQEEVGYVDVGIQLTVTPTAISDEGDVTLTLQPAISSVNRTVTTGGKNLIPVLDTTTAETQVVVKDGRPAFVGGLRSRVEPLRRRRGRSAGSGFPLIGGLFRPAGDQEEMAEFLVFVTPHIVTQDRLVTGEEKGLGGQIRSEFRDYPPSLRNATDLP